MNEETKTVSQKQVQLKSRPQGVPTEANFEVVTTEVGQPGEGEILVKNTWFSVDPYMRGRMNDSESYVPPFELGEPMEGGCVGEVIESNNDEFEVGDHVIGNLGWREYWISNGSGVNRIDVNVAEPQNYLSILGLTGMTAWVGLLKVGQLEEGETVFVSAASGAVGSIVCQIAKTMGCQVIGSSGSAEKIKWLKEEAGVDAAFNYKETDDVSAKLAELCPEGIDVYFDNVGGDHLAGAIDNMNDFGRIVCCGMISGYNDEKPTAGPSNLFKIIGKRIMMEGFIVRDHEDLTDEFQQEMGGWIREGKMNWEETVTEGVENAPGAFIDLFEGDKMGKALVKI